MVRSAIVGGERAILADVEVLGRADSRKLARVTLHLKRQGDPAGEAVRSFIEETVGRPASRRQHLTRAEYATRFGVSRADLAHARRFARQNGLRVVRDATLDRTHGRQSAHATVEVEGTVGDLGRAFGVQLLRVRDAQGRVYRTHQGAPQIPSEYADLIDNVLGLDTRPQANPRFRPLRSLGFRAASSEPAYSPDRVAALYNFPPDLTGRGQTIALLEFGGGFRRRDLRAYFHQLGLPLPEVSAVSVGAAANAPEDNPDGPDGEVMLDIEVAGAVAPGSRLAVYFAANTSRGFLRGINAAVQDDLRRPSILSISWGGPEATWTAADIRSIDRALEAAAAIGVSVFVAAGDAGSSDGMTGGLAHVDYPASSPLSTACGGTRLVFDETGALVDEVVWNDGDQGGTGGGISDVYSTPPVYQTGPAIHVPASVNPGGKSGRGVPDVSGNADPVTGYKVRVDGVDTVVGGTSAVAPLWAALFARINEGCGAPIGFANTLLYSVVAATSGALRDITEGDNDLDGSIGGYPAGVGWDPCSGLGTPADGAKILQAVKAA